MTDAPEHAMPSPGLWSLLDPIDKATFLGAYWEKTWLHVEGAARGAVADLVRLGDLERMLFDADGSKHPVYAIGDFLDGSRKDDQSPRDDLVDAWFRGGTLVFQDLDRRLPALSDFTRRLEADLSHRLRCQLYLTPPRARGFNAHYDPHDVFVLQVMGAKQWRIGRRVIERPLPTHSPDRAPPWRADETHEVTLRPGDVLYLPGGFPHDAMSGAEISCHLTFGVVSRSYLDLIVAAATAASLRDPAFRHQLPPDAVPSAAVALDLLSRITRDDVEEALRVLREKAASEPPRPTDGLLGLIESIGAIGQEERVCANPSARPYLRSRQNGVEVHAFGKCLTLPARLEPALRHCLAGPACAVGSLPGDIGLDDKIALVRRLLIEGILRLAERC
jgi:ribosomal protein L16 Arg81 hydroxylase